MVFRRYSSHASRGRRPSRLSPACPYPHQRVPSPHRMLSAARGQMRLPGFLFSMLPHLNLVALSALPLSAMPRQMQTLDSLFSMPPRLNLCARSVPALPAARRQIQLPDHPILMPPRPNLCARSALALPAFRLEERLRAGLLPPQPVPVSAVPPQPVPASPVVVEPSVITIKVLLYVIIALLFVIAVAEVANVWLNYSAIARKIAMTPAATCAALARDG